MRGLQHGQFSIYSGVDGWMLAHLTAGMGPVSSMFEAAMQVRMSNVYRRTSKEAWYSYLTNGARPPLPAARFRFISLILFISLFPIPYS